MSTIASALDALREQCRDLDGKHPGLWPPLPRTLCAIASIAVVVAAGGWLVWQPQWDELDLGRQNEQRLRTEFESKASQAQNIDNLRRQKAEVEARVSRLERQLPGKAEMDALLAEISQAGVARGIQFELFKPGQLSLSEYYAELPIEIRMTGNFHALASFVSDVANLPRIVTIDHIAITQQREGVLTFECVAHAFRYLDPAEAEQKKQQATDRKQRVKQ